MTRRTLKHRIPALLLAAALTVSCIVPAAAESVGDGVVSTYDEAYYATLDYYGNLLEGSVVKSYALNGKDSLTDYGAYDEVVNLTNGTAPTIRGEETSFRFDGAVPDHFYFEGKTEQPFENLPWTITLRYKLNGVPAKAEELAGKQGMVEILLDIVPNKNASDYARYNYTLEAMAVFNQDDILSLEAPGAQVQLVGNLRTALFLALPGEEQHFVIRVGSNDFSFGGLTVLMVPATLAQLEEIAKLSQRKDDLEEDYRALSGSLDSLLDALSDIQGGLYASARGLDQLETARRTFSGGKGVLYDGTDRLRGDLSNIADILEPVEQRVQLLSQTVTDSKEVLNEMADATLTLRTQLEDMEDALSGLESGTYDIKRVIRLTADMEDSLLHLEEALGGTHVGGDSVATESQAMVRKVKAVHSAYSEKNEMSFIEKMLTLQGKDPAEIQGMKTLLGMTQEQAEAAGMLSQWKEANAAAGQLRALYGVKDKISFQAFCGKLPGITPSQAKQMNDLWLIYNSGEVKKHTSAAEKKAAASDAEEVSKDNGEQEMTAKLVLNAPKDGEIDEKPPAGDSTTGDTSTGGDTGTGGDTSTGGDTGTGGDTSTGAHT